MPSAPDARRLLAELVGRPLSTVRGRPNRILSVGRETAIVSTGRSPRGQPVPIAMVQDGLEALFAHGSLAVDVATLGHRSAFVAAVLAALPETVVDTSGTPPRIVLSADRADEYRREVAGEVNAWWANDPDERFWLEITDRADIGVDLHAPQRDANGRRTAGYSLMWWVERGDVVFHYDLRTRSIEAWSRVVGSVVEAPVVWLSHRAATRRRLGVPRSQPGWWVDLDGPYPLATPLTLARLRERGEIVRAVLAELEQRQGRPLYFPFFFYGGDELRPMQPYLNKLAAALVEGLPELQGTAGHASIGAGAPDRRRKARERPDTTGPSAPRKLGAAYRRAHARELDPREPFAVDPAVVERGLAGHVETQNAIADQLAAAGLEPRSPRPDEPSFDLAWQKDGVVYVAEVKSITDANEERQLRLGLGQALRYRWLLGRSDVRAVLVAEREPRDPSWRSLCADAGVTLVTHADISSLLR